MSLNKKIGIIAAVLIVIGLIGSFATFSLRGEHVQINEVKIFDNTNFENAVIYANNAKIEVLPAKDSEARAELTGDGVIDRIDFDVNVKGDTLEVTMKEKRGKIFNFDFTRSQLKLKVYLPEKQYADIDISGINGEILAKDIQSKIFATDLVNGEIRLDNIKTLEDNSIDLENGRIYLDNVEGYIKSDLANGDIHMKTSDLDRDMDLEVINGKINIKSENKPTNTIISANITNGKADILGNTGKNIVIGNGEYKVNLHVTNGEIIVN